MKKQKLSHIFLFVAAMLLTCTFSLAGNNDSLTGKKNSFAVGLRFQKAAGFYWSNGISTEFTSDKILKRKISLGFNLVSSRLGTAMNSNAVPFFETDLSAIKYLRNTQSFRPMLRLNLGYAHANYESDEFSGLSNQSFLFSLEAGAAYQFKIPFSIAVSGGYNAITGNGLKGLGVIYPFYAQFSMFFDLMSEK